MWRRLNMDIVDSTYPWCSKKHFQDIARMRLCSKYTKRRLERILWDYCIYVALAFSVVGLLHFSLTSIEGLNPRKADFTRRTRTEHDEPSRAGAVSWIDAVRQRTIHQETIVEKEHHVSTTEPLVNISLRISKSPNDSHKYFYTNVIVHFDLKGAPPKVNYFLQLLELVAKGGATGVLIEWEDMFPWSGQLKSVRNVDAYTKKEVRTILKKAKTLDLEVIPLVQTFGHMEWILKYEKFRKFRENDEYPQVICIGDDEAVNIVKEAIKQVVNVHKHYGIKRFHIGADEAFEFGTCDASKVAQQRLGSIDILAINHVAKIASYVKKLTDGATVLAWHDMLKGFMEGDLKKMGLSALVEPVIWDYSEQLQAAESYVVTRLADIYGKVWASSAFKGADFPAAKYIRGEHYEANNIEWVMRQRSLRKQSYPVNFEGIIITGWSRYDHMAGLCEIWPVAEMSMLHNTQIALIGAQKALVHLKRDEISEKARVSVLQALGCTADYDFLTGNCSLPGKKVYAEFQSVFKGLTQKFEHELRSNHHILGWLSPYNIQHKISQNWYLKKISFAVQAYDYFNITAERIEAEMHKLFYANTVEEFLFTNVDPEVKKFTHYVRSIEELMEMRTYKRRGFRIRRRKSGQS